MDLNSRLLGLICNAMRTGDLSPIRQEITALKAIIASVEGILQSMTTFTTPVVKPSPPNEKVKAKVPRKPAAGQMTTVAWVHKIAKIIFADGPKRMAALKLVTGISNASATKALAHPWFSKEGLEYHLTTEGHQGIKEVLAQEQL